MLIKLHRNREELLHMALAARQTYLSGPTWQDSVNAIDRFLREVKGSPGRAGTFNVAPSGI